MQKYEKKLRNKYDIGKKRKRQNTILQTNNTKENEELEVDGSDEENQTESSLPKKKKKKVKKSKKPKNDDEKDTQSLLKKKSVLKNSVDEKIRDMSLKAGIISQRLEQLDFKPKSYDNIMNFEVSDIGSDNFSSLCKNNSENFLYFSDFKVSPTKIKCQKKVCKKIKSPKKPKSKKVL